MIDKKEAAILALLALLTITGVGWFSASLKPTHENIPYDNTYNWTEIFRGYEAYIDRRISYSVVSGTSMEPTFGENDKVLWVEVDPAELKVGDIIIYEHPTRPGFGSVAHRIIEVRVQDGVYGFRTQGDNMSEPDKYWVEEELQGLVIGALYSAPPE